MLIPDMERRLIPLGLLEQTTHLLSALTFTYTEVSKTTVASRT
jgi:hypothetical protein